MSPGIYFLQTNWWHMQHSVAQSTFCGSTLCIQCISPSSHWSYDHKLHKGISKSDYRIAFFIWKKDCHLSYVYLQDSSLHCSLTDVKTLYHFFLRLWRQNEIITIKHDPNQMCSPLAVLWCLLHHQVNRKQQYCCVATTVLILYIPVTFNE